MIVLDVEQGSSKWVEARLGIPTSSRFDSIITPKKWDYSKAARTYICELLVEKILGHPHDWGTTAWAERGTEMEDEARKYYEFRRDMPVQKVGFVYKDENRDVGGSPDGLVGDDGGLEIKCFSALHHMDCLLGSEVAPYTQVQGYMWLTGRKWWDVLSYNPAFPPVIDRIPRDEAFLEKWEKVFKRFQKEYAAAQERLDRMGPGGRVDNADLKAALKASLEVVK